MHLAWYLEHDNFWRAPQNLDCVAMTLSLARAAAEMGCRRFVGVGTCYEYDFGSGEVAARPRRRLCQERCMPPPRTLPDRRLDAFFGTTRPQFTWARLFYLYGAHEIPTRLVPSLAKRLAAGEVAPLSSGNVVRDFMDVRDAGAALAALTTSKVAGPINIASGVGISVAEVARYLGRISGRSDLLRFGELPDREGEPRKIVACVQRLKQKSDLAASDPSGRGWRKHTSGG